MQIGSPEHHLRHILVAQAFAEPERVTPLRETGLGKRPTRWSAFRTRGGGRRSNAIGFGFGMVFPEPVRGPLVVGYGAHFGLGTLTPADEASL